MDTATLEALKEELKKELLAEMQASKNRFPKAWEIVRDEVIRPRLLKFDWLSGPERYQMQTAVSAIIRSHFRIRHLANLSYEQIEEAKNITNHILNLAENKTED